MKNKEPISEDWAKNKIHNILKNGDHKLNELVNTVRSLAIHENIDLEPKAIHETLEHLIHDGTISYADENLINPMLKLK